MINTLSDWLAKKIERKELNTYSFEVSQSAIGEYLKSRRFPKYEKYKSICNTLDEPPTKKQYFKFKDNFIRNDKL